MESQNPKILKVIIVGDAGVGKSCFLLRMTEDKYKEIFELTVGVEFAAVMNPASNYKLQIWDTAGQESFRSISRSYYRGSHLQVFVYDISRRDTFEHIDSWVNEAASNSNETTHKLLVGCKSDLPNRQVSTEEGEKKALEYRAMFCEVSNKNCTQEELRTKVFELADKHILDNNL